MGKRSETGQEGLGLRGAPTPAFNEFLQGIEKVSRASREIIRYSSRIGSVKEILDSETSFRNLVIRPFGDGGSHIVIRGNEHVGKLTSVLIKKSKGGV